MQSLTLDGVYLGDDLGFHTIAKLPFLTSLAVKTANISFPLQQVSPLSVIGLRSLQIAHCCVFGRTGHELCSLLGGVTSLTSLQLSHLDCKPLLQGMNHLSSLSNLQRLDLTGTRTGNCASDWVLHLTRLSILTCTQSYVPASLPEAFSSRAHQPQGSSIRLTSPSTESHDVFLHDIDSCDMDTMYQWEKTEYHNASTWHHGNSSAESSYESMYHHAIEQEERQRHEIGWDSYDDDDYYDSEDEQNTGCCIS